MSLLLLFNDQVVANPSSFDTALTVQIDFEVGVATDVTVYCRSYEFNRGKQRELEQFQTGTGSMTLANGDRRFDPRYAAGPYFGNLQPGRRIRILETYGGGTYPLFEGKIDSIFQESHGPTDAAAIITFSDGLKELSRAALPTSVWALETEFDDPVAWWRLGEGDILDPAADAVGDRHLTTLLGFPVPGATSLIRNDEDTATTFTFAQGFSATHPMPMTTGPLTVEFWIDSTTAAAQNIFAMVTGPGDTGVSIFSSGGFIHFIVTTSTASQEVASTVAYNDGFAHHVACVWGTDNSLRIYHDGVDATDSADSVTGSFNGTVALFAINAVTISGASNTGIDGVLDDVVLHNTALSAVRVEEKADSGTNPWSTGEFAEPGPRIGRLLDYVAWPTLKRELDTGNNDLRVEDLSTTVLSDIQEIAQAEFGDFFITKDGNARLVARANRWNKTAVATLTDTDDYQASDPEYGDSQIKNDVTVGIFRKIDQDSIDEFGRSSYSIPETLGTFVDGRLIDESGAEYILSVYKDPLNRIGKLTIMPRSRRATTLYPIVLALELGDWLTIEETPQGVGATDSLTSVVEGIKFSWEPKRHVVELALSPADTNAYWLLGVVGFSELGETTRLGF